MTECPVYLGYDRREGEAYRVAEHSLRHCGANAVTALDAVALYKIRLLWRPVVNFGNQMIDHLSGSTQSTEFATARFLIPFLHRTGWCLFTDCDVVCLGDLSDLFSLADDRYAVMCVKHDHRPVERLKMDGQEQTAYPRKNWSSVVLWNCDHIAHTRLSVPMVNHWPGLLLHHFCWLRDEEIGALPPEWNWLVGVQPKPATPKLAHFTLGGPWIDGWQASEHDEIWIRARDQAITLHSRP